MNRFQASAPFLAVMTDASVFNDVFFSRAKDTGSSSTIMIFIAFLRLRFIGVPV
jgi:hypothetical protein